MIFCVIPHHNIRVQYVQSQSQSPPLTDNTSAGVFNMKPCISNSISVFPQKYQYDPEDPLIQLVNPLEYVYTNIPNTGASVGTWISSCATPVDRVFYELTELFFAQIPKQPIDALNAGCNYFPLASLTSFYPQLKDICLQRNYHTVINVSPSHESSAQCFRHLMRDTDSSTSSLDMLSMDTRGYSEWSVHTQSVSVSRQIDLFYFELNAKDYTTTSVYMYNMVRILCDILFHQTLGGTTIIKLGDIRHPIMVDVIYLLSTRYTNVVILKPEITHAFSNTCYLMCSQLKQPETRRGFLSNWVPLNARLLRNEIPCLILSKIEEFNATLYHNRAEMYSQYMRLIKNKSHVEDLRRAHIQKSVQWCKANKIPYNRAIRHVNMFLRKQSPLTMPFSDQSANLSREQMTANLSGVQLSQIEKVHKYPAKEAIQTFLQNIHTPDQIPMSAIAEFLPRR